MSNGTLQYKRKPMRSCEKSRKQLQILGSFQFARIGGLILLSNVALRDWGNCQIPDPCLHLPPPRLLDILTTKNVWCWLAHDTSMLPPVPSSRYFITSSKQQTPTSFLALHSRVDPKGPLICFLCLMSFMGEKITGSKVLVYSTVRVFYFLLHWSEKIS